MEDLRNRLRAIARDAMALDPAHDIAHLDRVWANARRIAEHETAVNMPVLLAACYLHDLINLPKSSPARAEASTLSAEAAVPHLRWLGFSRSQESATCHAIITHSYSAGLEAQSTEAAILRDADRLDAIGAIGIARAFAVSGTMELALYDPEDPFARNRPLDERRFALDHWQVKLLGLADTMLTPGGQYLARRRQRRMRAFLGDFAADIGHELPQHLRPDD
ncbi:HD domain-containing protein [Shimia sp.]|uniref:HD domain-containing protein n=1 Tax=Shimia sp. TaxID=1954381 RepID=UPI003561E609